MIVISNITNPHLWPFLFTNLLLPVHNRRILTNAWSSAHTPIEMARRRVHSHQKISSFFPIWYLQLQLHNSRPHRVKEPIFHLPIFISRYFFFLHAPIGFSNFFADTRHIQAVFPQCLALLPKNPQCRCQEASGRKQPQLHLCMWTPNKGCPTNYPSVKRITRSEISREVSYRQYGP